MQKEIIIDGEVYIKTYGEDGSVVSTLKKGEVEVPVEAPVEEPVMTPEVPEGMLSAEEIVENINE